MIYQFVLESSLGIIGYACFVGIFKVRPTNTVIIDLSNLRATLIFTGLEYNHGVWGYYSGSVFWEERHLRIEVRNHGQHFKHKKKT